jgi:hypothetical protein
MLHKILYKASGATSGIYQCANCRPTWCGQSELAPIGLHKTDAASDLLLIKQHCKLVQKACRESGYKINQIT